MQKEGKVRFLRYHDKAVKSVSFNPTERYIFCSCSSDGKINIYGSYNSSFHYLLVSYPMIGREINAVKFSGDGRRIIAALSSKKLAIFDVESGSVVNQYDDCCFSYNSREFVRIPIKTDPTFNYLAVTLSRNGRGVLFLDSRMPLPVNSFLCDLHSSEIRDIIFLNDSWPFVPKLNHSIATITSDGFCKVITLDGAVVQSFEIGHKTNSLTATPESYNLLANADYRSSIVFGGDFMSSYIPEPTSSSAENKPTVQPTRTVSNGNINCNPRSVFNLDISDYYFNNRHIYLRLNPLSNGNLTTSHSLSSSISIHPSIHNHSHSHSHNHLISSAGAVQAANAVALISQQQTRRLINGMINTTPIADRISLIKYGSNGGLLYASTNSNQKYSLQRFRRYPNDNRFVDELYAHKNEIYDFDISKLDEFIVTASKDKTVGIKCLGSPNHTTTSISELT